MGLLGDTLLDLSFVPDHERPVIELVRQVVKAFPAGSRAHDTDATFPVENMAALKEAGLMPLQAPTSFGGQGLSSLGYVAAAYLIGRGDAATALAFNMHSSTLVSICALADLSVQQRWFARVIGEGLTIAALGSEPQLKPFVDGAKPRTTVSRDGTGWRLTGRKTYCSNGRHADAYYVTVTLDDRVAFALVDADAPGIHKHQDWDVLSMRATESITIDFDGTPVKDGDLIVPTDPVRSMFLELEYALGYAPIYLAVAETAFRGACDMAAGALHQIFEQGPGHAHPDTARTFAQVGDMRLKMRPAWLMAQQAAIIEPVGSFERCVALAEAKAVACDCAVQVAELAMRVGGGRALSRSQPLEQPFRDAQAGMVMAFSPDHVRYITGRLELGFPPPFIEALITPLPAAAE